MKQLVICKADPITNAKPVEGIEIHIKEELPQSKKFETLKDLEKFYKVDATDLFHALRKNLPQGTLHQLLILLLKDTENLYRGI